jgi:hypothetical protein
MVYDELHLGSQEMMESHELSEFYYHKAVGFHNVLLEFATVEVHKDHPEVLAEHLELLMEHLEVEVHKARLEVSVEVRTAYPRGQYHTVSIGMASGGLHSSLPSCLAVSS